MKNKILIIPYDLNDKRFILVKSDPKINEGYDVIRKEVEDYNNLKDIFTKVLDKIGLNLVEIVNLNWGSVYLDKEETKELIFLALVKVASSEKNVNILGYKLNEFLEIIKWRDNKNLLKKVLQDGLMKRVYFDKRERGQ